MADWTGLHHDMLVLIARKIRLVQDFVYFCSVCRSWREAGVTDEQYIRSQIPWLMLPDKPEDVDHRQVYSLLKESILTKNLYIPEMSDKKCIGLNYGWVLTVSRKGEMNLVHPLSRSRIELPHQKSIDYYEQDRTWPSYLFTSSAALSANPSDQSSDFVLMIVHGGSGLYLSYWRRGDKRWTMVKNQERQTLYKDLIYYQDQFCAIEHTGEVLGLKFSGPHDSNINPARTLLARLDGALISYNTPYIVESRGGLLVVVRKGDWVDQDEEGEEIQVENSEGEEEVERVYESSGYWTLSFKVYKLDLIDSNYKEITSLGDRAIFLGHNTSTSLDHTSEFPGIKSNHIYFTDDCMESFVGLKRGGGKDMGSYNLEDGQITPFTVDESLSRSQISPPFWFIPS